MNPASVHNDSPNKPVCLFPSQGSRQAGFSFPTWPRRRRACKGDRRRVLATHDLRLGWFDSIAASFSMHRCRSLFRRADPPPTAGEGPARCIFHSRKGFITTGFPRMRNKTQVKKRARIRIGSAYQQTRPDRKVSMLNLKTKSRLCPTLTT